jgi:hypothetical protein
MKMKMFFIGLGAFLALAAAAAAGDISGKWIAPDNGVDVVMDFKVDGTKLEGEVDNPLFGKMKINDGKIDGDTISFYLIHPNNDEERRAVFKGTVKGNTIRFTVRMVDRGLKEIVAIKQ